MGAFASQLSARIHSPEADMSSLHGKVYVVTGGLTGIGLQTSLVLALRGADLLISARDIPRAQTALRKLEESHPSIAKRVTIFAADFSTMDGSRKGAERVMELTTRLDGLINGVGRLIDVPWSVNEEGIELSMAVNHFGTFVFTTTLLPLLRKTAKEPGSDVRIVTVGSNAMMQTPKNWKPSRKAFGETQAPTETKLNAFMVKFARYGTSKMLNTPFTVELQRQLAAEGSDIVCVSLHPGGVATDGLLQYGVVISAIVKTLWLSPAQGALTSLLALTSPEVRANKKYRGAYLHPYGKIVKPEFAPATDPGFARELWELTEQIVAEGGLKV
ncbi:hypothetical protein BCR35DRAFT_332227 [Leucosporidium creatinivorum]|uniref:NAD(P)-binding protein n=1 Tax=Leucosporidium creatinivorum TaxID=106004 RepID=A0A1Y2F6D0_9BASI|nr:hypothetical protein BCR35DRAFT_332227 [Leucosporidium creatinivorum]